MNRRQLLNTTGLGLIAGAAAHAGILPASATEAKGTGGDAKPQLKPLDISDYEPRSMLQVNETHVPTPRFPVIDIHTHVSFSVKSKNGVELSPQRGYVAAPEELLPVMDRKHIRAMVNLTGGYGAGLKDAVDKYDRRFPDRFYTFTEPSYSLFLKPDYPKLQAEAIGQAHQDGATGLKILKTLGLYLRENITTGELVKIDDRRFDPMWDTCGQLNMPVAIHVSDPTAFFTPTFLASS